MQSLISRQIVVKKSVYLFLRRVFYVEFFFSFLPLLLAYLLNIQDEYEATTVSNLLPYPIISVVVVTIVQVLAVFLIFAVWYFPAYGIYPDKIIHLRSNLFEDRNLVEIQEITQVRLRQGWLARRLNYGSLVLNRETNLENVIVRDVPNPTEVAQIIETFMAVNRTQKSLPDAENARQILNQGEGQFVEFKSSLVWDYYQQRANKDLYEPIMKTLVAFMNSRGGTLLIGVDDQGMVLGVENDISTLRKKDIDGFELAFNSVFNQMIGVQYRQYVMISFPVIDQKIICVAQVNPVPNPVYLNHNGQETFLIRAGNSSQSLTISQAADYIYTHFNP